MYTAGEQLPRKYRRPRSLKQCPRIFVFLETKIVENQENRGHF